jgi:signal transduction histidine kinase/CheY-like chemotaxis protein
MLESVFHDEPATWSADSRYFFSRKLPREEVFVTFTYGPITSLDGRNVDGIFCPCTETTEKIVSARRLDTLRNLGAETSETQTIEAACEKATAVLAENPYDVAFSAIYTFDRSGRCAKIQSSNGFSGLTDILPPSFDVSEGERPDWPFASVVQSRQTEELNMAGAGMRLPGGAWPEPAQTAVLMPLLSSTHQAVSGLLILGTSPRRPVDSDYRNFFDLIGAQIATAIANARSHEEEKRRAEALAEIDRAKTTFFSNVSHEFRTPLTLILGPLEDALAEDKEDWRRDWLQLLHRNAMRLQKLVNTLLDFSRIEAGRVRASFEATDLAVLTSELASVFRSAIEKAGMRLLVHCPALTEPIYVDRDMYEKIVLNLLSNAFKFTLEGDIEVRLRETAGVVELSVRDTGAGIAEDQLPHIFERFHRVEGIPARTHEGTGIGLALVQELAKLQGSSVRVESGLGEGSTFTLTLSKGKTHLPSDRIGARRGVALTPIAADDYLQEALSWLGRGPDEASPSDTKLQTDLCATAPVNIVRPRIVWADDNADMRDYVVRLLTPLYNVEACSNGETALAAVRRESPDLVLADVMMPRLDGAGLVKMLRADEQTREIPVILLSARAGEEARVEGLETGADDYLISPSAPASLLRVWKPT